MVLLKIELISTYFAVPSCDHVISVITHVGNLLWSKLTFINSCRWIVHVGVTNPNKTIFTYSSIHCINNAVIRVSPISTTVEAKNQRYHQNARFKIMHL